MPLICDSCGNVMTATDDSDSVVCANCGMEYGPDRLAEKRAELQPEQPAKKEEPAPKQGKPILRRVIRWLAIFAALDIIIGEKVTGLIFLGIIALLIVFGKPWS